MGGCPKSGQPPPSSGSPIRHLRATNSRRPPPPDLAAGVLRDAASAQDYGSTTTRGLERNLTSVARNIMSSPASSGSCSPMAPLRNSAFTTSLAPTSTISPIESGHEATLSPSIGPQRSSHPNSGQWNVQFLEWRNRNYFRVGQRRDRKPFSCGEDGCLQLPLFGFYDPIDGSLPRARRCRVAFRLA